jgi:hypothetical protein
VRNARDAAGGNTGYTRTGWLFATASAPRSIVASPIFWASRTSPKARPARTVRSGFQEQAQSYRNMESAADLAAAGENNAAKSAGWSAGLKFAAGIATLF